MRKVELSAQSNPAEDVRFVDERIRRRRISLRLSWRSPPSRGISANNVDAVRFRTFNDGAVVCAGRVADDDMVACFKRIRHLGILKEAQSCPLGLRSALTLRASLVLRIMGRSVGQ